jgi:hypothetical protein
MLKPTSRAIRLATPFASVGTGLLGMTTCLPSSRDSPATPDIYDRKPRHKVGAHPPPA